MGKKAKKSSTIEDLIRDQSELIKNQMIVTLGLAGVPQSKIREIAGVDIYRVNGIVQHLKRGKNGKAKETSGI